MGYIEIELNTNLEDVSIAKEDAEDLAWEHIKAYAEEVGIELGDDEYIEVFKTINAKYLNNIEYIKFLMLTAMITVRKLLESGFLSVPSNGNKMTDDEIVKYISMSSQELLKSFLWLLGGEGTSWTKNSDMGETKVTYIFDEDDVIITEEE